LGRTEWQELIEDQAASHLTQEEFCGQQGISVHRFRHWKYRGLKGGRRESGMVTSIDLPVSTSSFIPVEVVADGTPRSPRRLGGGSQGSGIEVLLPGGLRIGVGEGFEPAVLLRVMEVLGC
jgi:hypothetical protein